LLAPVAAAKAFLEVRPFQVLMMIVALVEQLEVVQRRR
jgi:hypothetical protein